MSFHKLIQSSLAFIFLLVIVSSCKVAPPPQLPSLKEVPATFAGKADSVSLGDIVWNEFFSDKKLLELIDIATRDNLSLLSTIQRVEVARANYQIRRGALLPSLHATATGNVASLPNDLVRASARQEEASRSIQQEYFLGLQSSWEIDLWGRLKSQREAAYARLLATEKGRHLVKTALVAEVARLYYQLLALDNELEVVHRNLDLQEVAVEMIKVQKMGGRATELAVQQFTAQLLSTKTLQEDIKLRIVEVENELNLLLGRFPQPIERGPALREQTLPENIDAGVPSVMLLRRPDIRQAELGLLAAKADVEAARAAFLPTLIISPYVGLNAARAVLLFQAPESLALGILGNLAAPIFQRNEIRANYLISVAQNREAVYEYQEAILSGYQEVATSLRRIEGYKNMYTLKEQEVEVLLNAVSTSNDMFATGYATYLEVITAQKSVLEAELELAAIRKSQYLSLVDLYRALGGGWQEK